MENINLSRNNNRMLYQRRTGMDYKYENRHKKYKNKISDLTYAVLEKLYYVINHESNKSSEWMNQEIKDLKVNVFKINGNLEAKDILLKSYVFYARYCILTEHLLSEYANLSSVDKIQIIDYYLFDNRLKELNCVGLSWYYDCKFKPSTVTAFRSEGGLCNWDNSQYNNFNSSRVDIMKSIINNCREHINTGNYKVKLRSYSKCFGIVLFKYLSIPINNSSVKLCVNNELHSNVIHLNNSLMSFQKFINSGEEIKSIDFCIDMTSVRNEKRDNLGKWMKIFLGGKSTEIQKMISPVSDKEVIVSYKSLEEKYYDLNQEELVYLLYEYYRLYSEKVLKTRNTFEVRFEKITEDIKNLENGKEYIDWITERVHDTPNTIVGKISEILSHVDWTQEKLDLDKGYDSLYKGESVNPSINVFKMILHKHVI